MKKMMVVLFVVIVFSGAFIVYGSGSVNEKRDFYSNFSQSFRSNRITFGYNIGHNTIKGNYIYTTPANGDLKVTMDNKGESRVFYSYPPII